MVRKIYFLALFLLVGTVFVSSCKKEELSSKKEVLSFIFDASKNAEQLDRNYLGVISATNISAEVAFGTSLTRLIPTLEISPRATLSPPSGQVTDFSGPVVYTVTAEDGSTKSFTASVAPAPAPYIGKWTGGPIDFGLGLLRVNAEFTKDGQMTLEFVKILTGEKDASSFKGSFEPISRPNSDIKVEQTHRWNMTDWVGESCCRTIMYQIITPQSMKLYYCICNPRSDWWFQINLTRQ